MEKKREYHWFSMPVDPISHNAPGYFDVVKEPMDFGTIKTKLENRANGFQMLEGDFARAVRLVFQNALDYNEPRKNVDICKAARTLSAIFEKELASYLKKRKKANTVVSSKSSLSGSEEALSSESDRRECERAIEALLKYRVRYEGKTYKAAEFYFNKPIDSALLPLYDKIIKKKMDLSTVRNNLNIGIYKTKRSFAEDVTRIFTNCLHYYYSEKLNPTAKMLRHFSYRLLDEFQKKYLPYRRLVGASIYPEDLVNCRVVFDKLCDMEYAIPSDSTRRVRPVLAFYNPITNVFSDNEMKEYRKKVKKLMCLSDISTKLNTYQFASPDDFADAVRLVFQNCLSFGKPILEETSGQSVLLLSGQYLKFFDKEYKSVREKLVAYDEVKRKRRERSESASSAVKQQLVKKIKIKKKRRNLPPGVLILNDLPTSANSLTQFVHTHNRNNTTQQKMGKIYHGTTLQSKS